MELFQEPLIAPLAGRTPRPYQVEAVQKSIEQLDGGSIGTLLRSPTGTGKSFMLALMANAWLSRSPQHRVMVGLHDLTLIYQLSEDLRNTLGISVGVEQAENHVNMNSLHHPHVIVCSRQSLYEKEVEGEDGQKMKASRLHKFRHDEFAWLFIFDECHKWRWGLKSCKHIIDWFAQSPQNKRLGLSATPERGDKAKFNKLFPSVCLDYKFTDAVKDGWIVPYRQKWINVKNVTIENQDEISSQVKMDRKFDEILSDVETLRAIVTPAIEQSEGRQSIIFTPDVKSAYAVAAEINSQAGFEAAKAIHGEVNREARQYVFQRHQRGDFQFLVVCGLCREGYDDPNVGCVVVLRPTRSRSLAEQMKGRGCRVLKGIVDGLETAEERREAIALSAKPDCIIVDMAGITGLTEVPSTVEILAEGLPDDVVQRAKKKAEQDGVDPMQALTEAEREIKNEREEQARLEAERRAAFKTRVDYEAHIVGNGEGGARNNRVENYVDEAEMATWKQVYKLQSLGISPGEARNMTKRQASMHIKHLLMKQGGKSSNPPTPAQIRLAERFGKPKPTSYEDGVRIVQEINKQLQEAKS